MSHVLLVDDDEAVRTSVARALRLHGHRVREGSSGDAALLLAGLELPDIAVLDVDMPVMSGLEACRALREVHPRLIIVVWSGLDQRQAAMDAGATVFLLKTSGVLGRLIDLIEGD